MYDTDDIPPAPIYFPSNRNIMIASGIPPPEAAYGQGINRMYEDKVIRSQLSYEQKARIQKDQLEKNYPIVYVVCHSAVMTVLSVTAILVQVIMIMQKSPNYFVYSGIWVGSYFLIAIFLALTVIFKRSIILYAISNIMYSIGLLVALGGLILANIINVKTYSTYNYVLIGIGVVSAIMSIQFSLFIPRCISRDSQVSPYESEEDPVSISY